MPYIAPVPATAQEPISKIIPGATKTRRKMQAAEPPNAVTDLRSRDDWMKTFNAIAAHDRRINKAALALGNRLALYHNVKSSQCNPSVKELAAVLGVSESTIDRGIKTLTTAGWISRKRGGRYDTADVLFHVPDNSSIDVNMVTCMAEAPYTSDSASIDVTQGDVTEEQRNREDSAAASPAARAADVEIQSLPNDTVTAADDAAHNPACETDPPETNRETPDGARLDRDRGGKDQGETQPLAASCYYPIGIAAANGAALDRIGHAARRPDNQPPPNEVSKIMENAIKGAGFMLRKLTPAESQRLAARRATFAKVRQRYPNKPDADADEVEALFNRMLLDLKSFAPFTKTYAGLMGDVHEGRIAVEDMPTLKTILQENWQRVHESGRRAQRAIEDARVAA